MEALWYVVVVLIYYFIGYWYLIALYYHKYHCDQNLRFFSFFFPYTIVDKIYDNTAEKESRMNRGAELRAEYKSYRCFMNQIPHSYFWLFVSIWPILVVFAYLVLTPYFLIKYAIK